MIHGITDGRAYKNRKILSFPLPFFKNHRNDPLMGREAAHMMGAVMYTGRVMMGEISCHIKNEYIREATVRNAGESLGIKPLGLLKADAIAVCPFNKGLNEFFCKKQGGADLKNLVKNGENNSADDVIYA